MYGPVSAQFKILGEGPVFTEPEDGYARILQLKNGNTFFLLLNMKRGIDIKLYNAAHRPKASRHLTAKFTRLKGAYISAIFEHSGNAVVMVAARDGKGLLLQRMILDGETGTMKEDETIATLPEVEYKHALAVTFGKVPVPGFYVRKDPYSDHYAVALMNSFEPDRNKRVEIVLYNDAHKEVNRAYYTSPEEKYKYIEFIDMAIAGDAVHAIGYAFNTRSSGGKEDVMILGTLEQGAGTIAVSELAFAHNRQVEHGVLKYNAHSGQLLLVAHLSTGKRNSNERDTRLAFIDPAKREVLTIKDLFPTAADEKSRELFGRKSGFDGLPVDLLMSPEGSFTIIYEEMVIKQWSTPSASFIATELKNLAVTMFDAKGVEQKTYFLPKEHFLLNTQYKPFYHARMHNSAANLFQGHQFKSFAYVNGKERNYILFNDVEENEKLVQKGKITKIQGLGECDGFYYPLEGKDALPARSFVFGKPADKKDHNMLLFAVSDYNRESNTYAAIRLVNNNGRKGVRLVWLQP